MILAARLMTPEELNALRPPTPRCVVIEFPTEGTALNFAASQDDHIKKYEHLCDVTRKSHCREAMSFKRRMGWDSNKNRSKHGDNRNDGRKPRRDH